MDAATGISDSIVLRKVDAIGGRCAPLDASRQTLRRINIGRQSKYDCGIRTFGLAVHPIYSQAGDDVSRPTVPLALSSTS